MVDSMATSVSRRSGIGVRLKDTPSSLTPLFFAISTSSEETEEYPDLASKSMRSNRSEEHTSELQSRLHLVCRLLLEKKKLIHLVVSPHTVATARKLARRAC